MTGPMSVPYSRNARSMGRRRRLGAARAGGRENDPRWTPGWSPILAGHGEL